MQTFSLGKPSKNEGSFSFMVVSLPINEGGMKEQIRTSPNEIMSLDDDHQWEQNS